MSQHPPEAPDNAAPPPSAPEDRTGSRPSHGPTRVGTAPQSPGSSPRERGADLPMPHERDEAAGHTARKPDPQIEQAKRDLDAGQVDTDLRGTPGLDAERLEQLVGPAEGSPDPAEGTVSDPDVGAGRQDAHRPADRHGKAR
jgi:hypothetical protein